MYFISAYHIYNKNIINIRITCINKIKYDQTLQQISIQHCQNLPWGKDVLPFDPRILDISGTRYLIHFKNCTMYKP